MWIDWNESSFPFWKFHTFLSKSEPITSFSPARFSQIPSTESQGWVVSRVIFGNSIHQSFIGGWFTHIYSVPPVFGLLVEGWGGYEDSGLKEAFQTQPCFGRLQTSWNYTIHTHTHTHALFATAKALTKIASIPCSYGLNFLLHSPT